MLNEDKMLKRSSDSAAMKPYWDQTDTIVQGAKAMKLAGDTYLPKFAGETKDDYETRLGLAKFTNIYRDVLEGLASKPFEDEVQLAGDTIPDEITKFIEDVDGSGNNLTVFSATTFFNGLNSAIDWIFIDYPIVDPNVVKTKADENNKGIRPFWSHVLGRNVLEARSSIIDGQEVLAYIRIFEPAANGLPDQVRIFERSITSVVTWELYQKKLTMQATNDTQFALVDSGTITINVIPLVPFITGRRDGRSFNLFPAMQDAADLQITLYQDESALQFIKTMAGYPMLAANGMKPQMEADGKTPKKIAIGPMKVLYGIPDAAGNHGTWTYIEPSAQSMTFLQNNIDKTKQDLRELGRQPLTAQSSQLTVITTAVAAGKAKTAVGAWTFMLKDSLENAFKITCKWLKIDFEPEVKVFNDFDDFTHNDVDLTTLTTMRAAGDISQQTLWDEMKRRKVLSADFDADLEKEQMLNEFPGDADLENADDSLTPPTGSGNKVPSAPGSATPPKPVKNDPKKKQKAKN